MSEKTYSDIKTIKKTVEDFILESIVKIDEDIEKAQAILRIIEGAKSTEIMTKGNFSTIIGKAKSRKTFLTTLIVASLLSDNIIQCLQSLESGKIAWFDTEQSRYHVQMIPKRIKRLLHKIPELLTIFCLRPYTYKQRVEMIENYLTSSSDLICVVIDGIRDLISDINDPNQATEIVEKLMRWSNDYNIHIIIIIHQNKGDYNARGHVGTEVVNKSETVISVSKLEQHKNISIVKPELTRGMEFKDFMFRVDAGLPIILDEDEQKSYLNNDF
jgi:hypothetical protein